MATEIVSINLMESQILYLFQLRRKVLLFNKDFLHYMHHYVHACAISMKQSNANNVIKRIFEIEARKCYKSGIVCKNFAKINNL